jgi:virginiamycin B lyase
MWFTTIDGILRATSVGNLTSYNVNDSKGVRTYPSAITSVPNGSLWFTQETGSSIGSITTSGKVAQFPILQSNGLPVKINGIAIGSDGALWFGAQDTSDFHLGPYIGKLTTSGASTLFPISNAAFGYFGADNITAGPDGALWFADSDTGSAAGSIGRITTSGSASSFQLTNVVPLYLTTGPDGALWFTGSNSISSTGGLIGRLTTSGTTSYYPIPNYVEEPLDGRYSNFVASQIRAGTDGAIYFMESNKIGRILLNQ